MRVNEFLRKILLSLSELIWGQVSSTISWLLSTVSWLFASVSWWLALLFALEFRCVLIESWCEFFKTWFVFKSWWWEIFELRCLNVTLAIKNSKSRALIDYRIFLKDLHDHFHSMPLLLETHHNHHERNKHEKGLFEHFESEISLLFPDGLFSDFT